MCTFARLIRLATAMVVLAGPTAAEAQRLTIPEVIALGGVGSVAAAGSGKTPTVTELLTQADLVVRGMVGIPNTYLSDDQYDVYTDYPIVDPIIMFQSFMSTSRRPGMPGTITVTQLGGTVTIGGFSFTQSESGLPPLEVGTEGLFVLKRVGEKYHFIWNYLGAFRISNGILEPLSEGFAPEYRGAPVSRVSEDIAARR